ncbi:hypothetical protein ZOSMA_67G00170 [Zostera marina]|uniref:Uncharacterized protein n=1 Tax=Zostera marina TaxID=29655 RepID=A0A0K9NU92_ZOSMR|nr:hypothetical protein ZOSMA_67G00170 [Zostera marina]
MADPSLVSPAEAEAVAAEEEVEAPPAPALDSSLADGVTTGFGSLRFCRLSISFCSSLSLLFLDSIKLRTLLWGEERRFDDMRCNIGKLAIFWTFHVLSLLFLQNKLCTETNHPGYLFTFIPISFTTGYLGCWFWNTSMFVQKSR